MPKSLKDIIGPRAGRNLAKGEEDFLDQHKVAEKDYPVKQKISNVPFKADNIKKDDSLRHGHNAPGASEIKYKDANEETLPKKSCNNTMEGTNCPMHGLKECMSENKKNMLKEKGMKEEVKQIDKAYKMTYAKFGSDKGKLTKTIKHTSIKFPEGETPKTPERIKNLVSNSPEHKELKSKGYRLTHYGEHAKDTSHEKVHGNKPVYESIEQIDEIGDTLKGKKVLGSYINKSAMSATSAAYNAGTTKSFGPNAKAHLKKERKRKAGIAQAVTRLTKESAGQEDVDYEGEMAKTQLKALANKAARLSMMMKDDQQLEAWVQSKISNAKQMVDAIHDYLVYRDPPEMNKETTGPDSPMTFPHMNVDNNYGAV
jgi:hypothetical protein